MEKKIFYSEGREGDLEDIHITRMYSSFVTVSEGRVIRITDPFLEYCPLAHFYQQKFYLAFYSER